MEKNSGEVKKPDITMFFPAYNEEKNIPIIIKSAEDVLKKFSNRHEILIVVYEGSKDNSISAVREIEKKNKNVRLVLQQKSDKGVGAAIRLGFRTAKYPYIFYADSDNQFDVNEFEKFMPYLNDYDVIAGYRLKRNDPLSRIITSKVYNSIVKVIFGVRERDLDCAFRLVRKKFVDETRFICRTGLATTELLAKARKKGCRIKQIGVNHYQRKFGKPVFEGKVLNLPRFRVVAELLREMKLLHKDLKNYRKQQVINNKYNSN